MENRCSRSLFALILTGILCFAVQAMGQTEPCCQSIDGNRNIGFLDTATAKLNEVIATLVVESVRTQTNPYKRFTSLRVLAKARVDTTLFSDAFRYGSGSLAGNPGAFIDYAPSAFPDTHTDSLGIPVLAAGDTLKNVFVLQMDPGNGRKEWHLSGIRCKFLTEENPPFPFTKALGDLNRFLDSTAVANGGTAGKIKLKLGPVFLPAAGDIGLQITANHDGNFWFVYKLVGSGDCPAGCTHHAETLYRMDAQGNVLIVSTRNFFSLCWPSEIVRRPGTPAPMTQATGCFTADGREVDQSPASKPIRARILRSASPK
jgi:hypothetical protein